MHQFPDSDGVIRSCTPIESAPNLAELTESYPLHIRSVTYFNERGQPQYVRESWLDDNGESEIVRWFRVTDALAYVEGKR